MTNTAETNSCIVVGAGMSNDDGHPRYRGSEGMSSVPGHPARGLDARTGERVVEVSVREGVEPRAIRGRGSGDHGLPPLPM